jgi:hypothetical protein
MAEAFKVPAPQARLHSASDPVLHDQPGAVVTYRLPEGGSWNTTIKARRPHLKK